MGKGLRPETRLLYILYTLMAFKKQVRGASQKMETTLDNSLKTINLFLSSSP